MREDGQKKKLLLHACCGPCSSACIERLHDEYELTIFFYNPNITDEEEYAKRRDNQLRLIEAGGHGADFIEGRYEPERFFELAKGLEGEKEGGARCEVCFRLRLGETAKAATELGFDCFDTTLSISPHKNYEKLKEIGKELEENGAPEFLAGNYKKQNGYLRSIELSKEYGLYRQNYCGCEFSKWWKEA